MNKLVYLAGPYAGCTEEEALGWRRKATGLLGAHNVVCPKWHPDELDFTTDRCRRIVDDDICDIDRSVALLANCWRPGWGTGMEIMYANMTNKMVVVVATGRISAWLRTHADYLTDTLEKATDWLGIQFRLDPTLRAPPDN